MALIKCPECGKEISDKAKVCINCGCPLEEVSTTGIVRIKMPTILLKALWVCFLPAELSYKIKPARYCGKANMGKMPVLV